LRASPKRDQFVSQRRHHVVAHILGAAVPATAGVSHPNGCSLSVIGSVINDDIEAELSLVQPFIEAELEVDQAIAI
jgi:hypothetical protein